MNADTADKTTICHDKICPSILSRQFQFCPLVRIGPRNFWCSYSVLAPNGSRKGSAHREHTILLSRERVNNRTKRMTEQFTFVSCSHLFYLTRFYLENCCLQILRNTVMLNSYLGLSALSKIFFMVYIKFDKGGNSLPKHFERTANRGRCL